jgi:hypothetical protein
LQAAAVFIGDQILSGLEPDSSADGDEEASASAVITSIILEMLAVAGDAGFTPKEIQTRLLREPDAEPKIRSSHPNYIYSLLNRLVTKGSLIRTSGRYHLP